MSSRMGSISCLWCGSTPWKRYCMPAKTQRWRARSTTRESCPDHPSQGARRAGFWSLSFPGESSSALSSSALLERCECEHAGPDYGEPNDWASTTSGARASAGWRPGCQSESSSYWSSMLQTAKTTGSSRRPLMASGIQRLRIRFARLHGRGALTHDAVGAIDHGGRATARDAGSLAGSR